MAELPQGLDRERHGDLVRRTTEPWTRRVLLTLLAAAAVAALLGVFGQRAHTSSAAGRAAQLEVRAPEVVRGGLLFQTTVRIRASQTIQHPRLVLDQGWLDGLQVNTIEPNPMSEATRDGRLVLSYDTLDPGDTLVVYFQFQLNPTSVGTTQNRIELDDADTPIAAVSRTLRRLP
jgi:hypothetical protein